LHAAAFHRRHPASDAVDRLACISPDGSREALAAAVLMRAASVWADGAEYATRAAGSSNGREHFRRLERNAKALRRHSFFHPADSGCWQSRSDFFFLHGTQNHPGFEPTAMPCITRQTVAGDADQLLTLPAANVSYVVVTPDRDFAEAPCSARQWKRWSGRHLEPSASGTLGRLPAAARGAPVILIRTSG